MIESSRKEDKKNRLISSEEKICDQHNFSNLLRPICLDEYVWQESIKKHLKVSIDSARIRWEVLDHILFYWPPWLWKTTISNIIALELWSNLKSTSWPAIEKQSDLVSILSNLDQGDILFIDEIHRLKPQIEEILYTAMEDFEIDIIVWSWTWAQSIKLPLKKFCLIWATTKLSTLSNPLRDRFWNVLKLDFYSEKELWQIIFNNSLKLSMTFSPYLIDTISKKSRGTPRVSNRLLKIMRDYYTIWRNLDDLSIIQQIFDDIWIDDLGLDYMDRKYLSVIFEKFWWWPVWLNTLASSIWEEESTLEDVVEPYLLQIWFIERTPRWRKITGPWINHLKK